MKWFDNWLYTKVRDMWDNRERYEDEKNRLSIKIRKTNMVGAQAMVEKSFEAEDTIRFELSTAVGGRILTVRRYDRRTDRSDNTTYVIPNGEDLSERMVKILNLEMFK